VLEWAADASGAPVQEHAVADGGARLMDLMA